MTAQQERLGTLKIRGGLNPDFQIPGADVADLGTDCDAIEIGS